MQIIFSFVPGIILLGIVSSIIFLTILRKQRKKGEKVSSLFLILLWLSGSIYLFYTTYIVNSADPSTPIPDYSLESLIWSLILTTIFLLIHVIAYTSEGVLVKE